MNSIKMYKSALSRLLIPAIALFITIPAKAQTDSLRTIHVGFIYPLSTAGTQAGLFTNKLSLHAISGLSRAETGVALYGIAGLIKQTADGVVASGIVNLVGGSARGVQLAGITNFIRRDAQGVQAAGIINTAESSSGAQFAGIANLVEKEARGIQVAGIANRSRVTHSQIAGLVNVAKTVKGVQIAGLINIADSSDYPIGLINLIRNGEKSVSVSVDETLTAMASFRSGGRVLYGILGVGYNFQENNDPVYGVESGLGAHIRITGRVRLNTEIITQQLSDFKKGEYAKYSLRILPAIRFGRMEAFAGPSANYVRYTQNKGEGFTKHFLWKDFKTDAFNGLFIGWVAGIQYHF